MPGKYMSDVKKAHILTLIGENVSLVETSKRTDRHLATVKLLKAEDITNPQTFVHARKISQHSPGRLLRRLINL